MFLCLLSSVHMLLHSCTPFDSCLQQTFGLPLGIACGCLQAIDNAQVDKLVQLAQMYGPEITRGAINQVGPTGTINVNIVAYRSNTTLKDRYQLCLTA